MFKKLILALVCLIFVLLASWYFLSKEEKSLIKYLALRTIYHSTQPFSDAKYHPWLLKIVGDQALEVATLKPAQIYTYASVSYAIGKKTENYRMVLESEALLAQDAVERKKFDRAAAFYRDAAIMADVYFEDFNRAKTYLEASLRYCRPDDFRFQADNYTSLGIIHAKHKELERASFFYTTAKVLITKTGDNQSLFTLLNAQANCSLRQGKLEQAEKEAQEALEIYREENFNNYKMESAILDTLATIYIAQGKFQLAEDHLLKAIKLQKLGIFLSNLGDLYSKMNRKEEALKYWDEAMATYKKEGEHPIKIEEIQQKIQKGSSKPIFPSIDKTL